MLHFLGLVLHIVGLATPAWSVVGVDDAHVQHVGPWRYCLSVGDISVCGSTSSAGCEGSGCCKCYRVLVLYGYTRVK